MRLFKKLKSLVNAPAEIEQIRVSLNALLVEYALDSIRRRNPDSLNLKGFSVFSQSDEDGILQEIFSTISIENGVFLEAGCGNGLENNTHYLLLNGWRGVWVDAEQSNIDYIRSQLPSSDKLQVVMSALDLENVSEIVSSALSNISSSSLDFLSLDIDGNDIYLLDKLLAFEPKVICVEYNPSFPPPAEICTEYRSEYTWQSDNYFGASLESFSRKLSGEGYHLVACSISGYNAFFVKKEFLSGLKSLSTVAAYNPSRLYTTHKRSAHRNSMKFLHDRLSSG